MRCGSCSTATVLPAIFLIANFLEHFGLCRKNEFSVLFSEDFSPKARSIFIALGAAMLILPLIFPTIFFPLVWGGFVFLLDPFVSHWRGRSLLQEWRQKNWNRTFQLLLAGFLCGGLWELFNFRAGAKWIYTVPLPSAFLNNPKIFEMPLLGFAGFPPFALECFVMAEFARNLKKRMTPSAWRLCMAGALSFSLGVCYFMDRITVWSYR